jgi:hypothetical protein
MLNITDEEKIILQVILSASNLCLVKGTLYDREATILALIDHSTLKVNPIAVILNKELLNNLKPDAENFE